MTESHNNQFDLAEGALTIDINVLDPKVRAQDQDLISGKKKVPGANAAERAENLEDARRREEVRVGLDAFAAAIKKNGVAEVHVLACNVGRGANGKEFTEKLAKYLGVTVVASTQYLYTNEKVDAKGNKTVTIGYPLCPCPSS